MHDHLSVDILKFVLLSMYQYWRNYAFNDLMGAVNNGMRP